MEYNIDLIKNLKMEHTINLNEFQKMNRKHFLCK